MWSAFVWIHRLFYLSLALSSFSRMTVSSLRDYGWWQANVCSVTFGDCTWTHFDTNSIREFASGNVCSVSVDRCFRFWFFFSFVPRLNARQVLRQKNHELKPSELRFRSASSQMVRLLWPMSFIILSGDPFQRPIEVYQESSKVTDVEVSCPYLPLLCFKDWLVHGRKDFLWPKQWGGIGDSIKTRARCINALPVSLTASHFTAFVYHSLLHYCGLGIGIYSRIDVRLSAVWNPKLHADVHWICNCYGTSPSP